MDSWVLHKDDHVIVINKPPDLAVQGGTGIKESIDAMLHGFKEKPESENPSLVHRLVRTAATKLSTPTSPITFL